MGGKHLWSVCLPLTTMDTDQQIKRISLMEQRFARVEASLKTLREAMAQYETVKPDIEALDSYYGSDLWRLDFDADEAGKLPKDMPRGVLSEDGLWNLLDQHRLLQQQMSQLSSDSKPAGILKDVYLAGGCFWGAEHFLKQINGVVDTEVGFANGNTDNPTYEEVYTDLTGYAEAVHVRYDATIVSLERLLELFFVAIDPTSLNKQGHDEGTRYRTGIYYTDPIDRPVIDKVFDEQQAKFEEPLVVERLPLKNFFTADERHQDYLDKNPDGYCHLPLELFAFARNANK